MPASKTGKEFILAFFLLFSSLFVCHAQSAAQSAGMDFPVIRILNQTDTTFKQYEDDVKYTRRLLSGPRPEPMRAAQSLTIYQYTVRSTDDFLFIAGRTNMSQSALATINRLNNPQSLETGMTFLLPSCPGIFIPSTVETDLEKILGSSRKSMEGGIELRINIRGRIYEYLFFPGADFSPTERAFFFNSGFRFPLRHYRVTSRYGIRSDPFSGHQQMHQGIDLAAPEGTEVFAVADGTVTAAGFDNVYGNYVIISHSGNFSSLYGHLLSIETVLQAEVKSGTLIGKVGSTGQSTGPHLHFELRQGGRAFDPSGRLRP